jgi:hypothetical protein
MLPCTTGGCLQLHAVLARLSKHLAIRSSSSGLCCAAGLLIGLGESRRERLADLFTIKQLQQQYGHIQEVIIQNFR